MKSQLGCICIKDGIALDYVNLAYISIHSTSVHAFIQYAKQNHKKWNQLLYIGLFYMCDYCTGGNFCGAKLSQMAPKMKTCR